MRKFLSKLLLLFSICVISVYILNHLFQNNYKHYTYHMMNEMYQSEDNIDVVFLGSSHVYRSYDVEIADQLLGCKTFNAGSSSQGMNTSYYLLREICKYHDVKTVYLDTYYGMANIPENDSQVFYITDYMKFGIDKLELLYSNGGTETVINGLLTFRRNRQNYNILNNLKSQQLDIYDYSSVKYSTEEYKGQGFVYSYVVADYENEAIYSSYARGFDLRSEKPVSDSYYNSLMNIIHYCNNNGIELVLINQPMPRRTTDYVLGYENYIDFIAGIAKENGIKYWNFDLYKYDMGLNMSCYKDGGHLNGEGAEIYTCFFCRFVNDVNNNIINPQDAFNDVYN